MSAYPGSNKAFSVERYSFWKEQLLQALPLIERRLDPQVRGAGQNALCEGQDALHVEFFQVVGVLVDLQQRELLAQLVFVTVVGVDVDRLSKKERFVEPVEFLLDGLRSAFDLREVVADLGLALLPRA